MKSLLFLLSLAGLMMLALPVSAQDQTPATKAKKVETATYKVAGVCNMCKNRIETAAMMKGVKFASWDKETQVLKVIYQTKKVASETILQAVADAGHDTEKIPAPKEAYQQLPACCQYLDGVEVH